MRVVFDVDGCLINSQELIRRSYLEAGVVTPDDILSYEGVDWLGERGYTPQESATIKRLKNLAYLRHVSKIVSTLPPYSVAKRLTYAGISCYAYTGAPHGTIDALRSWMLDWPFVDALDGVTTSVRMLLLHAVDEDFGVYVDDQSRLVNLPPRWRFVHYIGQDEDTLYNEIVGHLGMR